MMLTHLAETVNEDLGLVRRGQYLDIDLLLQIGAEPYYISIRSGCIVGLERGAKLMRPWRFAIRIDADAWHEFQQPVPKAGYHDLFALTKRGAASIDGDLQPLMANLRYFKELLAAARQTTVTA